MAARDKTNAEPTGSEQASADAVELTPCGWGVGPCSWPSHMSWHKPLSGRDARGSTMAILLMNNANASQPLGFRYGDVPGVGAGVTQCALFDVWRKQALGVVAGGGFSAAAVASRDSVFLTLSDCC